jgi:hypothetical protein
VNSYTEQFLAGSDNARPTAPTGARGVQHERIFAEARVLVTFERSSSGGGQPIAASISPNSFPISETEFTSTCSTTPWRTNYIQ